MRGFHRNARRLSGYDCTEAQPSTAHFARRSRHESEHEVGLASLHPLYRPCLRVALARDLIRFSNASLHFEPGLGFAYTFGDDLTFDSGREHDSNGFELLRSLSIGTELSF